MPCVKEHEHRVMVLPNWVKSKDRKKAFFLPTCDFGVGELLRWLHFLVVLEKNNFVALFFCLKTCTDFSSTAAGRNDAGVVNEEKSTLLLRY